MLSYRSFTWPLGVAILILFSHSYASASATSTPASDSPINQLSGLGLRAGSSSQLETTTLTTTPSQGLPVGGSRPDSNVTVPGFIVSKSLTSASWRQKFHALRPNHWASSAAGLFKVDHQVSWLMLQERSAANASPAPHITDIPIDDLPPSVFILRAPPQLLSDDEIELHVQRRTKLLIPHSIVEDNLAFTPAFGAKLTAAGGIFCPEVVESCHTGASGRTEERTSQSISSEHGATGCPDDIPPLEKPSFVDQYVQSSSSPTFCGNAPTETRNTKQISGSRSMEPPIPYSPQSLAKKRESWRKSRGQTLTCGTTRRNDDDIPPLVRPSAADQHVRNNISSTSRDNVPTKKKVQREGLDLDR